MMELTPRLRGLVGAELDLIKFGEAALAGGMRPLRISAADQVARGLTTVKEVLTVIPPIEHSEDPQP
jgi:general secretion pathway protein E